MKVILLLAMQSVLAANTKRYAKKLIKTKRYAKKPTKSVSINAEVTALDKAFAAKCPCFDAQDVRKFVRDAGAKNVNCHYHVDTDRRLRISTSDQFADLLGEAQIFTRAGVACFGPKVIKSGVQGLPSIGGYAMYDKQGKDCFRTLIRVLDDYGIVCEVVSPLLP